MLLNNIEDISLTWLNQVFGTESITAFTSKRIGKGVGWLGSLSLVTLESDNDSIPSSVVVKIQTTDEQNLASVEAFDLYRREVAFYENLCRDCSIITPVCYAADINQQRNHLCMTCHFSYLPAFLSMYDEQSRKKQSSSITKRISPDYYRKIELLCLQ